MQTDELNEHFQGRFSFSMSVLVQSHRDRVQHERGQIAKEGTRLRVLEGLNEVRGRRESGQANLQGSFVSQGTSEEVANYSELVDLERMRKWRDERSRRGGMRCGRAGKEGTRAVNLRNSYAGDHVDQINTELPENLNGALTVQSFV